MESEYSTTQLLTKETPTLNPELHSDKQARKEGGLRTKGWFKKSYRAKPLVTIVTVVYNDEDYLEETIQSVLNQKYDNVEYIVVDGQSTDGTLKIIGQYSEAIDFWISEEDGGIYDAMNKGARLATGGYIVYINSGDFLYQNDVLSNLSSFIRKEGRPDIIYGKTKVLYDENYFKVQNPEGEFKFEYGLPVIHQSILIKREIQQTYPFDTSYKIYSDFDTYYKLNRDGYNFVYYPGIISAFRFDGISSKLSYLSMKEKYQIGSKYKSFNTLKFLRHLCSTVFRTVLKRVTPYHIKRKIQISK